MYLVGLPVLMIPLCFAAGYFFNALALSIITIIVVVVGVVLLMKLKEMAGLFAIWYILCGLSALILMWVTYYQMTHQAWMGNFFKQSILRH